MKFSIKKIRPPVFTFNRLLVILTSIIIFQVGCDLFGNFDDAAETGNPTLLALTSEQDGAVKPDNAYKANDCSCGYKTARGSTMVNTANLDNPGALQFSGFMEHKYIPGEIIIKFRDGISQSEITRITATLGSSWISDIFTAGEGINSSLKKLTMPGRDNIEEIAERFTAHPDIEFAQPNYIYRAAALPDDPDFTRQWALHNSGKGIHSRDGKESIDINAPRAWDVISDCSSVIIAVLDTGINYRHRDLAENMWGSGTSSSNHGYDFIDSDDDPMDLNGHGTHVAGIIGARGNDGTGISGLCWKTQIMAVRVLDAAGKGTTESVIQGMGWALSQGAHIINISLGTQYPDPALKQAVSAARTRGVIITAAAGNSGTDSLFYPAAYSRDFDNVIAVAALDKKGNLSKFSSRNGRISWIDIAAPGENIISTWAGQSVVSTENFSDWQRTEEWGIGTYTYNSSEGPFSISMLTNPPARGEGTTYGNSLKSIAYKVFDLDAYGAISATVSFYLDYDLEPQSDNFYFAYKTGRDTPDTPLSFWKGTSGNRLISAGSFDLAPYLNTDTSLGFVLMTSSDRESQNRGVGIGNLSITRLYLNGTACTYMRGTSSAAPHVAGTAALCIARLMDVRGSYRNISDYTTVLEALLKGAHCKASLTESVNAGRMLNAAGAVTIIH